MESFHCSPLSSSTVGRRSTATPSRDVLCLAVPCCALLCPDVPPTVWTGYCACTWVRYLPTYLPPNSGPRDATRSEAKRHGGHLPASEPHLSARTQPKHSMQDVLQTCCAADVLQTHPSPSPSPSPRQPARQRQAQGQAKPSPGAPWRWRADAGSSGHHTRNYIAGTYLQATRTAHHRQHSTAQHSTAHHEPTLITHFHSTPPGTPTHSLSFVVP
jgi:hypothetical protein